MTISPGWYKDPAEPSTQRYWDGEGWIGAALPVDETPPAGPPPVEVVEEPPTPSPTPTPPPADATVPVPPPGMPEIPGLVQPVGPVRPHGLELASPGARFVARIVDTSVVLLLNVLVNGWFVYQFALDFVPYWRQLMIARTWNAMMEVQQPDRLSPLALVIIMLAAALWFAYEVPSTAQSGQTLGKRAARIKVVRVENLEPLGFIRAWRRWNPLGLPLLLIFCCGPLFPLFQLFDVIFVVTDPVQRMALHDRSAGTYVVRLPKEAPATKGS